MKRNAVTKKKHTTPSKSAKRKILPEDLLNFRLVSDPQISPDGKTILFTKKTVGEKNEYVTNLWIVPTTGGEPSQFTSGGKDACGRWSPDGSQIAFISGRNKPKPQIYLIPASGGEAKPLTKFPEGSIGRFKWSPNGKMIAVTFREADPEWTEKAKQEREEKGLSIPARVIEDVWYRLDGDGYFNKQRHHLYIVDVQTGKHRKVFDKDRTGWIDFDWSPDSTELAIAANLDKEPFFKPWKARIYRMNVKTGKLILLPDQPDGEKNTLLWAPNGKKIAFTGIEGKGDIWGGRNTHLFVIDAKKGGVVNLTGKEDYCLTAATLSDTRDAGFDANFIWSPDSNFIYFTVGWHGETHVATISAKGGKIKFLTSGEREFCMGNLSRDGKKMALATGSFLELNEIAVGTIGNHELKFEVLTQFNGDLLNSLLLSKPTSQWVRSADGTKVQVWFMKPVGLKPGQRVPAVLEIHGGPHAQYGVPFFHEFQVLAANGYAVFFSNPRGSKGYGETFCNAIKGDWGNKDWMDVQAVIAFMKKQPFVNQNKLGIMGGSYGGYMTNWAIGHTDEFAGAITDRCVSNLLSMAGNSDFPYIPDRYWEGNVWDRPEALWRSSPIKYFGNVKTPTMVIHSEGDLRCNVEQGEQVFSALKVLGVPTRFVRYPATTSHGLSRSGPPDLRIHRLQQILDWWSLYLKGKAKK